MLRRIRLAGPQKPVSVDVQAFGYLLEVLDRHVDAPLFDSADIGSMEPARMRQLLLRIAGACAKVPEIRRQDIENVH